MHCISEEIKNDYFYTRSTNRSTNNNLAPYYMGRTRVYDLEKIKGVNNA